VRPVEIACAKNGVRQLDAMLHFQQHQKIHCCQLDYLSTILHDNAPCQGGFFTQQNGFSFDYFYGAPVRQGSVQKLAD
jgi:hypothetical protein